MRKRTVNPVVIAPDVARDQESQFCFLGLENHTPATTARFLDDAVV